MAALQDGQIDAALEEFIGNPLLRVQGSIYAQSFEGVSRFLRELATQAALGKAQLYFEEGEPLTGLALLGTGSRNLWTKSGLPIQLQRFYFRDDPRTLGSLNDRIALELALAMEGVPAGSLPELLSIASVVFELDELAPHRSSDRQRPTESAIEKLRSEAHRLVAGTLELDGNDGSAAYIVDSVLKATGNFLLARDAVAPPFGVSLRQRGCNAELRGLSIGLGNRLTSASRTAVNTIDVDIDLSCSLSTVDELSVAEETSTYISGYNSLSNPTYAALVNDLAQAQAAYNRAVYANSTNPTFSNGIIEAFSGGQVAGIRRKLANTKPFIQSPVLMPYSLFRFESARTSTIHAEVTITVADRMRTFSVESSQTRSAKGKRGVLDTDQQGNGNVSPRFSAERESWRATVDELGVEISSGLEGPTRQLIGQYLKGYLDSGDAVEALALAFWYDNLDPELRLMVSVFPDFDLRKPAPIPKPNIVGLTELFPSLAPGRPRVLVRDSIDLDSLMTAVVSIETEDARGSGFFVSHDGLVVTNYHVIDGARQIAVETSNGDQFLARLELSDVNRDLAILRVAYSPATVLELARQRALRLGERVYAAGSPLGLSGSVTEGIISGFRSFDGVRFIQTDAAINSGNSGGPLLDADGFVVGVNTLAVKKDVAEGLGFAVIADEVRAAFSGLIPD